MANVITSQNWETNYNRPKISMFQIQKIVKHKIP
jgi:hypothetical protein